jgi:soluble lytic murein transglycosylase
VRTNLKSWLATADTASAAAVPNNPVFADMVRTEILAHAHQAELVDAQQEKGARDTLMNTALGLGPGGAPFQGGTKPTSIGDLLATPEARAAWTTVDATTQRGLMELLDHNAKGVDPPLTNDALSEYYRLKGMAARDPDAFGEVNLAKPETSNLLPHHLQIDLMNLQAAMTTRQARDEQKGLNFQHATEIARPMLLGAGIAVPTKPGEKAAVYDQFLGRLSQALDTLQTTNKRAPHDDEIRKVASGLLMQGTQPGTGWLHDTAVRAFQVEPGQFAPTVPPADRQAISGAFQKNFGRAPTDAEIGQWYMRAQGAKP